MKPENKHKLFENIEDNKYSKLENIEDITRESMIKYGTYIIEDRAIPSMLDGLKPVQRRSLYTLKEDKLIGSKRVKLAKIVGSVMGSLHPHGDSSIVGTFVNMSQPFKNNFKLLNPQGNYGSIGNPGSHAAMRYIENGIETKYADLLFENLEKENVVSWQPNYDDTVMEPKVLPVKYPYHLLNGTSGIAYAMSTKTPSFNIIEMTNLFLKMIDDKFYQVDYQLTNERKKEYIEILRGPDFPTGTNIYFDNKDNFRLDSLFSNQFSFRMRANYEIKEDISEIHFKNIPYEVSTDNLVEELINLRQSYIERNGKKIPKNQDDILNISTNPVVETRSDDATIILEFRKDADLVVELAKIFKNTSLDKPYSCNNTVISEDGIPVSVSVFDNLKTFLLFRQHVVYSALLDDIKQLNKRIPLLEAYLKIIDGKETFIKLVTEIEDEEELYNELEKEFNINKVQIDFLLGIQVKRLTKKSVKKFEEELEEKTSERARKEIESSSSENVFKLIRNDYERLLQEQFIFKSERKSKIIDTPLTFNKEDLIKDKEIILSVMSDNTIGWVENNIRVKSRGTQSTTTAKKADDIFVKTVVYCNLKSHLACVTNYGRVFKVRGFDFNSKFYHISNILNLQPGENLVTITKLDLDIEEKEFLFITKKGQGSKSNISFFRNATKNRAIIGIKLSEGDEVLSFNLVNKNDDIVLITSKGKALRFPISDIRMTQSAGKGVFVYGGKENDIIKSSLIVSENDKEKDVIVVFEYGGIKKFNISELKVKKRNQVGLIITKAKEEEGELVDGTIIDEGENILLLSKLGESGIIKPNDIKSVARVSIGVRKGLVLKEGDTIIKMNPVKKVGIEEFEEDDSNIDETKDIELIIDTQIN